MRRGVIACFERGALNLRGNRRLLLTLLVKSVVSTAIAAATLIPILRMLGLGEAYLQLLAGRPDQFSEFIADWVVAFQVPPQLPWVVTLAILGGLTQILVQTFFDAGALGILAAGDRQAPAQAPATGPLTADWFETFEWREFLGQGACLVWRLLLWRLVVGLLLAVASMLPFFFLGMLLKGTEGVVVIAGCFAILVVSTLVSLAWIWWWVVEMHMAWLPVSAAVGTGSRSFLRRGGGWLLLTGIGGLLLIAALVPVLLLASSLQMFGGSSVAGVLSLQVVSGVVQAIGLGAVMFLLWAAAIALARDEQHSRVGDEL